MGREVFGKNIVDQLHIDNGFSLWWMGLLSEKNPVKTKTIQVSLRIMAIMIMGVIWLYLLIGQIQGRWDDEE